VDAVTVSVAGFETPSFGVDMTEELGIQAVSKVTLRIRIDKALIFTILLS
jgi:predicted naringenin-chalcone synthase